ncbi:MAG: hypothetical protein K2J15_01380, partial [Muribaculaceae bacterium]|nr:hypothetical protein [Muribaculaceae bacterium]
MYNLQELYDMEPANVVDIAASMGMKNASAEDLQETIYYILDHQATDIAKQEAAKGTSRNKTEKKERKPRRTKAEKETSDEAEKDA